MSAGIAGAEGGVAVGVAVGVFVAVAVGVLVGVLVGVAVGVLVGVAVGVAVGVLVGVGHTPCGSVTVTLKEHAVRLPLVSVAVQVTCVTPMGRNDPGGGKHANDWSPQTSEADAM